MLGADGIASVRRIPAPVVRSHLLIVLVDLLLLQRVLWRWRLLAPTFQLLRLGDLLLMVPRLEPCIGALTSIRRIVKRNTSSMDKSMDLFSVLQAQRFLLVEAPSGYPLA